MNRRTFIGLAGAAALGTALGDQLLNEPRPPRLLGCDVASGPDSMWLVAWGPDSVHQIFPAPRSRQLYVHPRIAEEASQQGLTDAQGRVCGVHLIPTEPLLG